MAEHQRNLLFTGRTYLGGMQCIRSILSGLFSLVAATLGLLPTPALAQSLIYDPAVFTLEPTAMQIEAPHRSAPTSQFTADSAALEEGGMTTVDPPAQPDEPMAVEAALPPPPPPLHQNMAQADGPAVDQGRSYGRLRWGGKLRLTNGVATLDGASGGGLAAWAVIAGRETVEGIGGSAHLTFAELPDYNWQSHGAAIGLFNRLELSYARQNLDLIDVGAALGLGRSYVLNQDVFGAKLRLFGDAVYGEPWVPQLSAGVQYKNNLDEAVTRFVGAKSSDGTDFYLAATKILLAQSTLVTATLRYTKANQLGLLGFGGDRSDDRSVQFEGSVGYMLSRNLVLGAEYRTKPDNLGIAEENDWLDIYAAWSFGDHITFTAAYVDLGTIAIVDEQRGALLSLQAAF